MPQNLAIGSFVLGGVLLLIAVVGGGFKIFGAEVSGAAGPKARIAAAVLGVAFVTIGIIPPGSLRAVEDQKTDSTRSPSVEDPKPDSARAPHELNLYTIAGSYSLVFESDEVSIPAGLGISIEPVSATTGLCTCNLPFYQLGDSVATMKGRGACTLNGTDLEIKLGGTYTLWRTVSVAGSHLTMSWNSDGKEHKWIFQKEG